MTKLFIAALATAAFSLTAAPSVAVAAPADTVSLGEGCPAGGCKGKDKGKKGDESASAPVVQLGEGCPAGGCKGKDKGKKGDETA